MRIKWLLDQLERTQGRDHEINKQIRRLFSKGNLTRKKDFKSSMLVDIESEIENAKQKQSNRNIATKRRQEMEGENMDSFKDTTSEGASGEEESEQGIFNDDIKAEEVHSQIDRTQKGQNCNNTARDTGHKKRQRNGIYYNERKKQKQDLRKEKERLIESLSL